MSDLFMMKSTQRGVCPRCHTFIGKNSPIVRLPEPEVPWSDDGGESCYRTGGYWYFDGRPISMRPRRWCHWRCYVDVMVEECACVYCGSEEDITVDHVIPRRYGGSDQPYNLVPACRTCNCKKGTQPREVVGLTPAEVRRWLESKRWVRVGNKWQPPGEETTYSQAIAVRIAAFGHRTVVGQSPPAAKVETVSVSLLEGWA